MTAATLPPIALTVLVVLALGYRFYGRCIARQYALDDATATPAVTKSDGVDFVPTRRFYLLGQHFSAIAAAGPIAGPILACQVFGGCHAALDRDRCSPDQGGPRFLEPRGFGRHGRSIAGSQDRDGRTAWMA